MNIHLNKTAIVFCFVLAEDLMAATSSAEQADAERCPAVEEAYRREVAAKVGKKRITVCDVSEALNKMSPYLRKEYEAPQKRQEFVDNMIRFELIAQAAEWLGFGALQPV